MLHCACSMLPIKLKSSTACPHSLANCQSSEKSIQVKEFHKMGNKNSKATEKTVFDDNVTDAVGVQVGRYVDTVLGLGKERLDELEKLVKDKQATSDESGDGSTQKTTDPNPVSPPVKSILAKFEDWQLKQLGLGRGVDGTNPRPWVNKSSFQVRNPVIQPPGKGYSDDTCNLACTDEGELVQDFLHEVTTIREQKAKFELSVAVPNAPVTVGAGADLTRKLTTKQNAYGKRIYSQTIAFKPVSAETEDLGLSELLKIAGFEIEREHDTSTYLSSKDLENNLRTHYGPEPEEQDFCEAVRNFYTFLKRYRITHYVSSITLGASVFVVESETNSEKTFSTSGSAGYEPVISTKEASLTFTKKVESNSKDIQQVGKLTFKKDGDGTNTYKIEKEAVVEMKLAPLVSLFHNETWREAMKTALEWFLAEERQRKEGPFLISCNDGKVFWKVTEDAHGHAYLHATDNKADASKFYILLTDENYDFYIGWQRPQGDKTGNSTMRYLQAKVTVCGRNEGPLCFETKGDKQHSLFAINARFGESFYILPGKQGTHGKNVNPEIWLDAEDRNQESFLLRCVKRKGRVDGFVAVARNPTGGSGEAYRTITRTNARGPDDGIIFMTFRLHKLKYNPPCSTEPCASGTSRSISRPVGEEEHDTSC